MIYFILFPRGFALARVNRLCFVLSFFDIPITCCVLFHRDMKVVILGDAGVGKTTLIHRYLHGIFAQTISVSTDEFSVAMHQRHQRLSF